MPKISSFKEILELLVVFEIMYVEGENFLKINKRADQNKTLQVGIYLHN
jgi:hypothetical protein